MTTLVNFSAGAALAAALLMAHSASANDAEPKIRGAQENITAQEESGDPRIVPSGEEVNTLIVDGGPGDEAAEKMGIIVVEKPGDEPAQTRGIIVEDRPSDEAAQRMGIIVVEKPGDEASQKMGIIVVEKPGDEASQKMGIIVVE